MALLIGGTLAYLFLPFPWWLVVVALLVGVEVFEFRIWWWALRERPRSGIQSLVGERGVLASADRVRIRGTSYPARVPGGSPGDAVVVEDVDGMTLVVRPATEEDFPT
jgi:membrane protein implicated in regulation of membrane protease activity